MRALCLDHQWRLLLLVVVVALQWRPIHGDPFSFSVGIGSAVTIGMSYFLSGHKLIKCQFYECCTDRWIRPNETALRDAMSSRFYGQHLAQQTVVKAVLAHMRNPSPKKALVISFHGWTGTGKNFLAAMIADAIFVRGMRSQFVHLFVSNLHFPHDDDVALYKRQLRQWIRGNVSECDRSLFIFDEVDKLSPTVMDAIKPFIDHYETLDGVDFRKSIFLFLSNSAGNDIAARALQYHEAGKQREAITLQEMEEIVTVNAFNEPGGLKFSELIANHLIDHFVPFLPLERRHVMMCVRDFLLQRGYAVSDERLAAIADLLQYFPMRNPIFSSSGCKRIAQKAELYLANVENPLHDPFAIAAGAEHDEL